MPESLFQKVAGLRITSLLKRGSSTAGFFAFQNIYGRLLLYGELINLRHRFLVCLSSILTIFCLTGFQYPCFQYILVCYDAAFKARLFSSDFSLACKDGRATAATCKYYCPLVVNPTFTNSCKQLHLKCGRDLSLKMSPCTKTSLFSYYFEILPPLLKVTVFFCYFVQYDDVFLIDLLDGCYHYLVLRDPVNDYSNSELLVKEYVSLKSKIRLGYACLIIFCYRSFLL